MSVMEHLKIYFQKLDHGSDLPLPQYESSEAAGMDLRAALTEPLILRAGHRALVPTGFKMALPSGYEAQIRPRSGLAWKFGITMLNSPGTIDSDYRGEVKVLAINHSDHDFTIHHGDRIAQMVIAPVIRITPVSVDQLPESDRSDGGFGSTGVK